MTTRVPEKNARVINEGVSEMLCPPTFSVQKELRTVFFSVSMFWVEVFFWYIYLEPVCPLFWGLNPTKEGLFQSKQGLFGFQVCTVLNYCRCATSVNLHFPKEFPP